MDRKNLIKNSKISIISVNFSVESYERESQASTDTAKDFFYMIS